MGVARVIPPAPRIEPALRAKALPRSLNPLRAAARQVGARALDQACSTHGVGNDRLAKALGLTNDRGAAEARSGAVPVTLGEAVLLPSLPVAIDTVVELLRERVAREVIATGDSVELRMASVHVDALRALLSHR